ncbi:hypothetical protein [Maribacter sp. 4G9]|uniref:hypothetical protein n=1 Tax=Maribacter sp. 4G9 TaxID=1889777 RepID=UPI000C14997F|nr:MULTISPECIES: hypothetical protein [Flavobacteriaceae]PIB37661.1 hypothetical protein BFP75_20030 [Maribacter sp. 4G9]|tara:strand:+ start:773 stop:1225 length:453 start_codon:yes stop_codon:yes gene_type:complete
MQKPNKIAAFFFLGVFSLMMLHQVFPHQHHQHEHSHSHSLSHSEIAHTGEHHHHDDDSQEKEESPYGFFGFFMDMHIHSTVSSDIVVLERNTIEQQTVVEKDVVKNSLETQNIFSIEYRQNNKPPVYHPPNKLCNPYLSSLDLRGPPSLG